MTQGERLTRLFQTIRDWKVKNYGMCKQDAASDIQEFMAQCCTIWNKDSYTREYMSDTKIIALLRIYFKDAKASYLKYKTS